MAFSWVPGLVERRKELGMSYRHIANETGLSISTIQRMFAGKNVMFRNLILVATIMGLEFYIESMKDGLRLEPNTEEREMSDEQGDS